MTTSIQAEQASLNPIENQRKQALKHYEEASSAIHHWSGFVQKAIEAYNPELEEELRGIIENLRAERNQYRQAFEEIQSKSQALADYHKPQKEGFEKFDLMNYVPGVQSSDSTSLASHSCTPTSLLDTWVKDQEYDFSNGVKLSESDYERWIEHALESLQKEGTEFITQRCGRGMLVAIKYKELQEIQMFEIRNGYKNITYRIDPINRGDVAGSQTNSIDKK